MDGKLICFDFGFGCWKLHSLLISCPWALVLATCRNPGMVFKEQCLSQVTVRFCETTQWNGHFRRFWKVGSAYEREVMGRKKRWWMKKVGWTLGKTRKFSGRLLGFRKITFFPSKLLAKLLGNLHVCIDTLMILFHYHWKLTAREEARLVGDLPKLQMPKSVLRCWLPWSVPETSWGTTDTPVPRPMHQL